MSGSSALRIMLGAACGLALAGAAVYFVPRPDVQGRDNVQSPDAAAAPAPSIAPEAAAAPGVAETALVLADPDTSEPASAMEEIAGGQVQDAPLVQEPAERAEAGQPDAEQPAVEQAVAATSAPTFDVVRIDADGTGLIAGRAGAGARVSILLDDGVVVEVRVDATGRFVEFVDLGTSDKPRLLSLLADPQGAAQPSEGTVIIAPTQTVVALGPVEDDPADANTAADVAVAVPGTPRETDAELAAASPAVAPESNGDVTNSTPDDTLDPQAGNVARGAVLLADADGVRVLQPATGPDASPEVLANIALDTITYDAGGDVLLAGRATGEGTVNVYIDNQPVARAQVGPDGRWSGDLPQDVQTGVRTLRVDQLDAAGEVVSRIETPFLREDRTAIAAAMEAQTSQTGFQVAMKTVQPGATLWAIARERYGDGVLYVQVFEANRDRIRNPDLIYPGQVFQLPEIETIPATAP